MLLIRGVFFTRRGRVLTPPLKKGMRAMRRAKVTSQTTTSRPGYLVCPVCGSGELLPPVGSGLAGCDSCGCAFDSAVVGTLEQIVALPDALGKHACEECGHPEMRCLPDGTYHCPACGSEVLPAGPGFELS